MDRLTIAVRAAQALLGLYWAACVLSMLLVVAQVNSWPGFPTAGSPSMAAVMLAQPWTMLLVVLPERVEPASSLFVVAGMLANYAVLWSLAAVLKRKAEKDEPEAR